MKQKFMVALCMMGILSLPLAAQEPRLGKNWIASLTSTDSPALDDLTNRVASLATRDRTLRYLGGGLSIGLGVPLALYGYQFIQEPTDTVLDLFFLPLFSLLMVEGIVLTGGGIAAFLIPTRNERYHKAIRADLLAGEGSDTLYPRLLANFRIASDNAALRRRISGFVYAGAGIYSLYVNGLSSYPADDQWFLPFGVIGMGLSCFFLKSPIELAYDEHRARFP
jgi:hypothetical protein